MNEIERAIKLISKGEIDYSGTYNGKINEQVSKVILVAFREQAEREKGCTHCQKPYVSIGGINEDKAIIYLGAERPYTKGNVDYLHHMDSAGRMNAFKIKFCPVRGRKPGA